MMDENPENIRGPLSSISEDQFQGRKFDYMITNPPFGVSWKSEKEFVDEEQKIPTDVSLWEPQDPLMGPFIPSTSN